MIGAVDALTAFYRLCDPLRRPIADHREADRGSALMSTMQFFRTGAPLTRSGDAMRRFDLRRSLLALSDEGGDRPTFELRSLPPQVAAGGTP